MKRTSVALSAYNKWEIILLILRNLLALSSNMVKICEKIDVEFIFTLDFAQILTELLLDFTKEAILFLIYFLADN